MMERLLQHSGWLKALSVALAILLWVIVVPRYAQDQTEEFEVPLEVIYHPDYFLEEGPQDNSRTVLVRVQGKNFAVQKVRANGLRAVVDYSGVKEPGRQQQVKVQASGNFSGVTYSANPDSIPVTLVAKSEAAFPVEVQTTVGSVVAHNGKEYLYTAKAEADEIRISGRIDFLDQVRYGRVVLDAVDLVPNNTNIRKQVIPTDASGKSVDKLAAAYVNVSLTWAELPPGKSFKVQPTTKGALPGGLAVASMEVQPAAVTVRAASLGGDLPNRDVVETEPIDLTGKNRTFTTTVRVVPPPGTTVAIETVNVKINIAEVPQEKQLKGIPLQIRGQATNAEVSTAITDVQIVVRGSYNTVNALQPRDVTAYVDVEGLGGGKHILPVKVAAPPGVSGADADPPTVEVTISTP